jgi:SNF2 family DNA or RNA helicase
MVKCAVCYAWCPQHWDGVSKWKDVVARCSLKGKHTTSGESCPDGSIIKPRTAVATPVAVARTAPVVHKPAPVVQETRKELFPHQREAVERFKDEPIAALFMEAGCGKTCVFLRIASYKFTKGEIDALLIVSPNGVHTQTGRQEVPKWIDCPYEIQVLFGDGGAKQAYPFDEDPSKLKIVSVNIDVFSTKSKWEDLVEWANGQRTMIILDEATTVKNPDSQRAQRMLYAFNDVLRNKQRVVRSTVKCPHRIIATGTPVTNSVVDLWSMFEFLSPNYFGKNYWAFTNTYQMQCTMLAGERIIRVPLSEERWKEVHAISDYAEAHALTGVTEDTFLAVHAQDHYQGPYKHADKLRDQVDKAAYFKKLRDCVEMPPQNYVTRELIMSADIARCYKDMKTALIATYEGHEMYAASALTALIRLAQISSGFIVERKEEQMVSPQVAETTDHIASLYGLADDDDLMPNEVHWIKESNPKLEALYRDIEGLEKPVIVITRFTAEAARIFEDLCTKYKVMLYTGWRKSASIEAFQNGEFDIMVANSAVVARGFNLQRSHTILFYSNTFSLETRVQTEARVFRLGQRAPCTYFDYAYADTVDLKIVGVLQMKRNLLDYITHASIKEVLE